MAHLLGDAAWWSQTWEGSTDALLAFPTELQVRDASNTGQSRECDTCQKKTLGRAFRSDRKSQPPNALLRRATFRVSSNRPGRHRRARRVAVGFAGLLAYCSPAGFTDGSGNVRRPQCPDCERHLGFLAAELDSPAIGFHAGDLSFILILRTQSQRVTGHDHPVCLPKVRALNSSQ
jgi:hypothetical protein